MTMKAISLVDSLHTVPERHTHIDDVVHIHSLPLFLHRGLQGVRVWVGCGTGLGLHT